MKLSFILVTFLCYFSLLCHTQDYLVEVFDSKEKSIGFLNVWVSNGTDYISLDDIIKTFNGTRKYDSRSKEVILNISGKNISLEVDKAQIRIDGNSFTLSKPVILLRGKIAVSVDFVSDVLPVVLGRRVSLDLEDGTLKLGAKIVAQQEIPPAELLTSRKIRVIIDPGHGGTDIGARAVNGTLEKELNLEVALKMKEILSAQNNIEVFLTRTEDSYLNIEDRRSFANDLRGDLFISIHFNWSRSQNSRGFSVYVNNSKVHFDSVLPSPEINTSDTDKLLSDSKRLANIIMENMKGVFATNVKYKESPLALMRGLFMPGVLVEILYLSNQNDLELLSKDDFLDSVSTSLSNAILKFASTIK